MTMLSPAARQALASITVHGSTYPHRSMTLVPGRDGAGWTCRDFPHDAVPDYYANGRQVTVYHDRGPTWFAAVQDADGSQVGPVEYGDSLENAAMNLLLQLPPRAYGILPAITGATTYTAPGAA